MRQREEDMKWGVHNTSHRVQQPRGHMILWSTWIHGGCEHSSTSPGKRHSALVFFGLLQYYCLKHSCRLPSQSQVMLQLLFQRQGTEITAVNVLPGTICAAASFMLSSLGTDCHKLIQFSNWCHRSYWWHGIFTQLCNQQQSRQQKTSSCGIFLSNSQEFFLKLSGQSTIYTGNVKTSRWDEEAYHQYPTRLFPT